MSATIGSTLSCLLSLVLLVTLISIQLGTTFIKRDCCYLCESHGSPRDPPLGPPWGLTVRPQVGTGWAGVSAPGGDIYVHM